jgi:hypothetical protein
MNKTDLRNPTAATENWGGGSYIQVLLHLGTQGETEKLKSTSSQAKLLLLPYHSVGQWNLPPTADIDSSTSPGGQRQEKHDDTIPIKKKDHMPGEMTNFKYKA